MAFEVGQQYVSEATPGLVAHVIQAEDDGHKASVELRRPDGTLERSALPVVYAQFSDFWTLMPSE